MLQQINLFQVLPQPKKSLLTLRRLSLWYGIFTAMLALNFIFELWDEHKLAKTNVALNAQMDQIQQHLTSIKAQYPMIDTTDIQASVKKLETEFNEKNQVVALLSKTANFSTYLTGLAKSTVSDLWLTKIHITVSEHDIILVGLALNTPAVQNFMNALAHQKEFKSFNFQLQALAEVKHHTPTLWTFTISNKVEN
jgi:hypothetical protein